MRHMRLAVAFLAALLLTLTMLVAQGCRPAASQARTLTTAVADEAVLDSSLCRVFADTEAPGAGASEARDVQPEVEDSTEVVAAGTLAMSPMAPSQARVVVSARDVPFPCLDGLLRPPRTLNG